MAKLGELYASQFDVNELAYAYADRRVLVKILDLWWWVSRRSVLYFVEVMEGEFKGGRWKLHEGELFKEGS